MSDKLRGGTTIGGNVAWHAGNMGAGSGLDSDLLDGQQGAYYQNASNLTSGTVPDSRISGSYTGMTNLTGSGTVDFSKFYGNAADTVTAPSFSWTTDTNTGIYQPAADQLAITTGGVQRALFSSSGITGTLVGNASTATKLATARKINGVAFDGTTNITVADSTKLPLAGGTLSGNLNISNTQAPVLTIMQTGSAVQGEQARIEFKAPDRQDVAIRLNTFDVVRAPFGLHIEKAPSNKQTEFKAYLSVEGDIISDGIFSGNGSALTSLNAANLAFGTIPDARLSGNYTGVNITGNAGSATKLATVRTINGTNFDGTGSISTVNWGVARAITIGNTVKAVNGSGNVSWAHTEIGVVPATANTLALRDGSADISARLFRTNYDNETSISNTAAVIMRVNNSTDNYIKPITAAGFKAWMQANNLHITAYEQSKSLGNSGYMRFTNGLIIQWGVGQTQTSGYADVGFPIVFPNRACYLSSMHHGSDVAPTSNITLEKSWFKILMKNQSGSVGMIWGFTWIAIGY